MKMNQPSNPTDEIRHRLLIDALKPLGREEDYNDIIELSSPPIDITRIAPKNAFKGVKIGVIGAGVAGLAATYELRKLGYDITLIEGSSNHIGGRIYTHYFTPENFGELGAMRIPVSHETTWHYINLFGLETIPFIQSSQNDRIYASKKRLVGIDLDLQIKEVLYPLYELSEWEKSNPFFKWVERLYNDPLLKLTQSERRQLLQIRPNYDSKINEYDAVSFRQYCELAGFTQGAIQLLSQILGIDRGLFYSSFIELLREMYGVNFSYLYRIKNGNVNLPLAFYNSFLDNDGRQGTVQVKSGNLVTGMIYHPNTKTITLETRDVTNKLNYYNFDYVISAVPFSKLRLYTLNPYFSKDKMQAIQEVTYLPSQKTILMIRFKGYSYYSFL